MFFYLSFLRPLPHVLNTTSSVTLTPQIANDLRTELLEYEQDIYYAWLSSLGSCTGWKKLTTWRTSNAYKAVSASPPAGVRDREQYQLVLSSVLPNGLIRNAFDVRTIDLKDEDIGGFPFPVMSMPIVFSNRAAKHGPPQKQELIQRLYTFVWDAEKNDRTDILLTEQLSFDLDKKIWDSGIGLSSFLVSLATSPEPLSSDLSGLKDCLCSKESKNIIELGAGTGMVSILLSSLRAHLQTSAGKLVATDLESALPLLSRNISQNQAAQVRYPIEAQELDWVHPEDSLSIANGDKFDLIVMADVTYNTAFFGALINTLEVLIKLAEDDPPLLLLGYKERDPEERTLWSLAENIGVTFTQVGKRRGAGGHEVEIWLGRVNK